MTIKFEKKGLSFEIEINGTQCTLRHNDLEQKATPVRKRHSTHGMVWGYEIESGDIAKKLIGKNKALTIAHNTAEEVYEIIRKAKREKEAEEVKNSEIKLSYYFGDWYRVNALFSNGEILEFGNIGNIFENEKLQEVLDDYPNREKVAKKLSSYIRGLFEESFENTDQKLELPGVKFEYKKYDDLRGKGRYVQSITFDSFEIFEEYVLKALQEDIKKAQKEKQRLENAEKEARETGHNVEINRYTEECNDPQEDCSLDIVTIYMTPSGRQKAVRTHTY